MAQFVGTQIEIEGVQIKQFSSFTLSQSIFEHHSFRLICPAEGIDGTTGAIFNSSKNMIGCSITVKIDAIGNKGALRFSGVVTQIEAMRHGGHAGDIIISGFSPTILLDSGPHCKSWENATIKSIAQDVLKHFPQNLLQPKVSPVYSGSLAYMVQYKETAWEFLCRIAASFGEWLFYDGQKLYLSSPPGNNVKLLYGSNLHAFNMGLQVRPASFKMMAYDYMNSDVYDGTPSGIESKAGLNELGKHAFKKSEKFYASKPKLWHNDFLTTKKQLDDYVNTRAAMESSSMVKLNGSSGHPGIQVGGSVTVDGKNIFSQADESYGEYTTVAITHNCDGQGNYTNDFVAIPSTVKMPPVKIYKEPHSETQSAIVTDNNDPGGLGRIRVKFHWMNGAEKSPWMRVTTPHAGGGKGMFFIPEKNEEVIVGFEGDSPTKPYIIGSVYHGKANNTFSNSDNDVKIIQSRSGHIIEMNDKEGAESITVIDKNKNKIIIRTADDSIEITANGSINMNASDINMTAGVISMLASAAITMNAGAAIEAAAGTMVTFGAGISTSMISGRDTVILAGKSLSASGGKDVKLSAGAGSSLELDAKGEATFISKKKIKISSKESNMLGTDKIDIQSKKTIIEGSSKAVIKGSAVDIS
jgi:type VI secretion system secreted protein VgrG